MTRPLYILSFRHRDELAALAAEGGWHVVATRRLDDAGRRLSASGAAVVVLDTRGAIDEALAAARALGEAAVGRGAALLVLVSRGELHQLDALRAAGATHFVASPFAEDEFRQALCFAEASAERREIVRTIGTGDPTGAARDGFLGRDLARALAADEIEMLFQPQVAIADGAIVGVEALMRWQHPQLGELGADTLLDAADRAGLASELSTHVQTRALTDAAAWPAALGGLRLAVNITAADIAAPDFVATLLARVTASGFARERLTVEITERGVIGDLERAAALLGELRAAGLRVAIDDFGTGYSSLAYLSALPLDYLKLDRVLSQDIVGSSRDRVVVRGVIAMAHSLGLEVVAEGVETAAQRDLLAREGCTFFQGFLCSAPVTGAALASLVAAA
ncbi:MAG: EAL domain-containing protein [Pseudomonadota bacterium]